jgi:Ca-activated chloride channel family protein
MDLLWPWSLLLLAGIPVLIAAYIWTLRRRKRFTIRYSSLSLIRRAVPPPSRFRRHLPFGLLLAALACLIVALARPVSVVTVPGGQATIILALDVSRSMCSTDIPPNRLEAAKDAALSFISRQRSSTRIGIVAFARTAEVIQAPTDDQELLQDAIESIVVGRRTAIGSAILKSLDAIAEIDPAVAPSSSQGSSVIVPTPVAKGAYAPDVIVLLTDGANNDGASPQDAAQQAADRGVRVYTIGFGTENGSPFLPFCGERFDGNDPTQGRGFFGGGGGGGGGGFRRGIDEEALQSIADKTGGEYYGPTSADELNEVFRSLPTYLITKHETLEVSVAFAIAGAILAALAVSLSMLWNPLP